ncbi:MAG: hypothetical protein RXR31_06690 [Thermoproteota archaeon]|jgi:hypothetical protein
MVEFTPVSLSKAKKDIKESLEKIGIKVNEVARCVANVIYRKSTLSYLYNHEFSNIEVALRKFVEESKEDKIGEFYMWSEYEGGNRYLNIGYFLKSTNGLIKLVTISVQVPQI